MPIRYKIVKDNFFIIPIINKYQSKKDTIVISTGSKFYYYVIDKDTLKEIKRYGFITNISDDGNITIDISTRYNSNVQVLDIKTFILRYLDSMLVETDYTFPGNICDLKPDLVVSEDKYIIFEPQDNIIIKEEDIVSNIRTRDIGRLIDLKINKDRKTVSYKLDCSSDHYSNIILFEDDFNYDTADGEMVAYNINLEKENPLE